MVEKVKLTEVWKPVVGYEGSYEVTNTGDIRSLSRITPYNLKGKILNQHLDKNGYLRVNLRKFNSEKDFLVHILVLEAFISLRPYKKWGLHKNDVRVDNRLTNLYWGTPKENVQDAFLNGRFWSQKPELMLQHRQRLSLRQR